MKLIDDLRRENLLRLRREFEGVKGLADHLGKSESQVSQWLNASAHSVTGKPRGMRSTTARWIEEVCGKPTGWLDTDHALDDLLETKKEYKTLFLQRMKDDGITDPAQINSQNPNASRQLLHLQEKLDKINAEIERLYPSPVKTGNFAVNEPKQSEYLGLSEEEQQLISAYRQAGDAERNFILRAAGVRISPSSDMRTELNPVKSWPAGSFTGAGADEAAEEVVGGTKNSPHKRAGEGGR